MLNVEVARQALKEIMEPFEGIVSPFDKEFKLLEGFIYEVERLLHYNAIKQTPALFKVPKP